MRRKPQRCCEDVRRAPRAAQHDDGSRPASGVHRIAGRAAPQQSEPVSWKRNRLQALGTGDGVGRFSENPPRVLKVGPCRRADAMLRLEEHDEAALPADDGKAAVALACDARGSRTGRGRAVRRPSAVRSDDGATRDRARGDRRLARRNARGCVETFCSAGATKASSVLCLRRRHEGEGARHSVAADIAAQRTSVRAVAEDCRSALLRRCTVHGLPAPAVAAP